jgi:hypothetical protein
MVAIQRACILAALFIAAGSAPAQEQDVVKRRTERIAFEAHTVTDGPGMAAGAVEFISSDMLPGQLVKGAPYSAEAVTESVQTLADGNRITRRTTGAVARDSEGRTRRDSALSAIGSLPAADAPRLAFIHDPVANAHYILDEKARTARKMAIRQTMITDGNRVERTFDVRVAGPAEPRDQIALAPPNIMFERVRADNVNSRQEDLGTRDIDGVQAAGTRRTITIPAGEFGNERPIEIVTERWFSPELKTLVYSRHSDPRMGETTFRLTHISRIEPVKSLFEVPADYKVIEPGELRSPEMKIRR